MSQSTAIQTPCRSLSKCLYCIVVLRRLINNACSLTEVGIHLEDHEHVDHDSDAYKNYSFLLDQLELMSKLAYGRNKHSIEILHNNITYASCFRVLQSPNYPDAVRSRYAELICSLYIDVGDNIDVMREVSEMH